jgi:hypothetical protein
MQPLISHSFSYVERIGFFETDIAFEPCCFHSLIEDCV